VKAINDRNWKNAAACVIDGKTTLPQEFTLSAMDLPKVALKIVSVKSQGATSVISTETLYDSVPEPYKEKILVKRLPMGWKISVNAKQIIEKKAENEFLLPVAAVIVSPTDFLIHIENSSCANLSELSLAVIKLAKENKGRLALKNSSFTKEVFTITDDNLLFISQFDTRAQKAMSQLEQLDYEEKAIGFSSYSFNENLTGLSIETIVNPEKVVLLYEGNNAVPVVHPTGNALVVFADGRCKKIKASDLKTLRWKP